MDLVLTNVYNHRNTLWKTEGFIWKNAHSSYKEKNRLLEEKKFKAIIQHGGFPLVQASVSIHRSRHSRWKKRGTFHINSLPLFTYMCIIWRNELILDRNMGNCLIRNRGYNFQTFLKVINYWNLWYVNVQGKNGNRRPKDYWVASGTFLQNFQEYVLYNFDLSFHLADGANLFPI